MKKKIKFIGTDGGTYTFNTEKNELNGNQMYWVEPIPGMYATNLREVNRIINGIRKNNTILEEE